jgi:hypothetical protein
VGFAVLTYGPGHAGHPLLGVAAFLLVYTTTLLAMNGRQVLLELREVLAATRPGKSAAPTAVARGAPEGAELAGAASSGTSRASA